MLASPASTARRVAIASAALVACLAMPNAAMAAGTLYVDAASSEPAATCGASTAPCATLADALTHATGGEEINVAPGSYAGAQVTVPVHLRGARAGQPGTQRAIGAPGGSTITGTLVVRASATIDGFDFAGVAGGPAIRFASAAPGQGPGASVVVNDTFSDVDGAAAIVADAQLRGLIVSGNQFVGGPGAADAGVWVHAELVGGSPDVLVERNVFRGLRGAAVDAGGTPGLVVRLNEAHDVGSLVVLADTDSPVARTVVRENTGEGFSGHALYVGRGTRGVTFAQNRLRAGDRAVLRIDDWRGTGPTGDIELVGSDASGFASGISLDGTSIDGTIDVHGNRLVDVQRRGAALQNDSSGSLDATRNWWGRSAGLRAGSTSGGGIDAGTPLRLVGVTAPGSVFTGGSGSVSVQLVGAPGSGPDPDASGFAVTFSITPAATLSSTTVPVARGSAGTMFTAGSTPGQATTTATLDEEAVSATTRIVASGGDLDPGAALPSVADSRPAHARFLVTTRVLPLRDVRTRGLRLRVTTNIPAATRTTYTISHYDAKLLGLRPMGDDSHDPFVIARVRTTAARGTRTTTAWLRPRPAALLRRADRRIAVNVDTIVRSRGGFTRRHYRRIVLPADLR